MLRLSLTAAALMAAFAATMQPGRADADAPVCLYYHGKGEGLSCDFQNLQQCQATAQGQSASCVTNPRHVSRTGGIDSTRQASRAGARKKRVPL